MTHQFVDLLVLGFTGTRRRVSAYQMQCIQALVTEIPWTTVHHGACKGADAIFHEAAHRVQKGSQRIEVWPSDIVATTAQRCIDTATIVHGEADPFIRNHEIVDACDILIACPRSSKEELRSGTWATVRYARKMGKPIISVI